MTHAAEAVIISERVAVKRKNDRVILDKGI